jgi:hypothetical protein
MEKKFSAILSITGRHSHSKAWPDHLTLARIAIILAPVADLVWHNGRTKV